MSSLRRVLIGGHKNLCMVSGINGLHYNKRRRFSGEQCNNKLYEYRVYQVWPKDFKAFVTLTNEWLHLRMNHSKLIGYWACEIGGINDVAHIWEYDSLSHRAAVRAALAADEEWISKYFSKMLPMLMRQENALLKMVGNGCLEQPKQKGVYEIEVFPKNGDPIKELPVSKGDAQLLANFQSTIGPMNKAYQLWFHSSIDAMAENQEHADGKNINDGHSRLLVPMPFSPLQ